MGQTFRWWQLRSSHRRTAVDGRTVERSDCSKIAGHPTSKGTRRASGVRHSSESQDRCLNSGPLAWGGWEPMVYLMKMTVKSDSALFWLLTSFLLFLFFFLISDCIMLQNPRAGDCCLQIFTVWAISTHGWNTLWHWAWLWFFSFQLDVGRLLDQKFKKHICHGAYFLAILHSS